MKIKLAILCPIRRKITSGQEGMLENKIAALAGELAGMGVDVTLLAAGGSRSACKLEEIIPKALEDSPGADPAEGEAAALAEAFGRIKEFDLVHSYFGLSAVSCALITGTPMVAVIEGGLPAGRAAVWDKHKGSIRFVAAGSAQDSAGEYLALYRELLSKRENHRPWGFYENLAEGADHKIKRITVAPGARLSYQKHSRRSERWIIISGQAVVTLEGENIPLTAGETVLIPKGSAHRVYNPGAVPMVFAEVQLGDYFGEDDIIRLQDDYGR